MEIITRHIASLEKYYSEIAVYFTVIMTGATWVLGGWDDAIKILLCIILLDIITGVLVGFFVKKSFSSHRLRKGFATKIGYLIVISACNLVDMMMFQDTPILRTASIWFYTYVEASSVFENAGNLGVPIPQFIVDRMEQINRKVGGAAKMKDGKFVPSKKDKNDDAPVG